MMKSVSLLLLLGALGVSPAFAGSTGLADRAWQVKLPEGPRVEMALEADGTGRLTAGPVSSDISWTVANDELCIYGGMVGGLCMRLIAADDALLGVEPSGKRYTFLPAL